MKLDAGVPIQNLGIQQPRRGHRPQAATGQATIKLSPADSIPNKDFVLRYGVIGKKPEMAVLGHTGNYSGDRQASRQRLLHADDSAARKTSG